MDSWQLWAIAGLSPHDLSRTVVSHGGVDLAAQWDRRPEVVEQVMVEWLRYQLEISWLGSWLWGLQRLVDSNSHFKESAAIGRDFQF
jgi:hypothetical protein